MIGRPRHVLLCSSRSRFPRHALAYVQDTVRGRIDPNKISGYHDFKRKQVNLAPASETMRA
ncbi:hypothetical protein [Rhizobium yanglingense]